MCSEFLDGSSSHAPEERVTMGEKAVNQVHQFLEVIAKEVRSLMQRVCEERIRLSSSVSSPPSGCYGSIAST